MNPVKKLHGLWAEATLSDSETTELYIQELFSQIKLFAAEGNSLTKDYLLAACLDAADYIQLVRL